MVDFSNVAKLKFDGKPVPYIIEELEGHPTLFVLPANDSNEELLNYVLKNSAKLQRIARQKADANVLAATRKQDRDTYSRFVIKGWDDVVEANGQAVPFTAENCHAFLTALPDFIFDRLRTFCMDATNFMNVDEDGLFENEPAAPAEPGN